MDTATTAARVRRRNQADPNSPTTADLGLGVGRHTEDSKAFRRRGKKADLILVISPALLQHTYTVLFGLKLYNIRILKALSVLISIAFCGRRCYASCVVALVISLGQVW